MTSFASFRAQSRRDTDILVAMSFALVLGGVASACASGAGATTAEGGVDGQAGQRADAGLDAGAVEVPAPVPIAVPTPTFAASRPSADCAAALATPVAPLLLDATISCAGGGGLKSLVAGADGVGFVAVGGARADASTRVLSVSAKGVVSGDQGPVGADIAGLVAEPAGGVDLVSFGDGLNFFHAVDGGWMRELLVPPTPGMIALLESFYLDGAGRSPDGGVTLAYTHRLDIGVDAVMATRSAAGSWTALPLPIVFPTDSAMAVPPAGAPILVHAEELSPTLLALDAWSSGSDSELVSLPKTNDQSVSDSVQSVGAAINAAGALTASFETRRQGVVIVRPAGASPRTVALAGTQVAVPAGCPVLPPTSTMAMARMTCTETGIGGSGRHTLAAAADGATWVAYVLSHIDRDLSQFCAPSFSGGGFNCGGELTTDRSTSELVLERLAADGGHAVRWRASLGAGDGVFLMDADVGGARLVLAFSSPSPPAGGPTFRYVVVDTTGP